jgi:hypothetical protein
LRKKVGKKKTKRKEREKKRINNDAALWITNKRPCIEFPNGLSLSFS